ncbi:MAG: radical SAM protein [Betaproteobacteria bacterium]
MNDQRNESDTAMITPLSCLLVKVHSRCNLMCDYCYEYNCGNTSWRKKPKEMSEVVYEQMLLRVRDHSLRHGVREQFFSFHGGEPLLRRPDFFRYAVARAKEVLGPEISIKFGTQTNATLLTEETVNLFAELEIGVGVSIDGPEHVHNKNRVYSNGRPSYQDTLSGLQHLLTERGRSIFGGILAVMDVNEDPIPVFEHLSSFRPPSVDFLEPHGNWDELPIGKASADDLRYADWLIRLFDYWFDGGGRAVPIRKFEEIIEHLLGGKGSVESFGLEPVSLLTIATDGAIEMVDCIKASGPDAEYLGLNVFDHEFDAALAHPMMRLRQIGIDALAASCRSCKLVWVCGGGYLPHRYSTNNGYINPTIYCSDYKKLIQHIQYRLEDVLND